MKIDFLSDANMGTFWSYIKMILSSIQPGVMLWFAISAAGVLIGIIVNAFKKAKQESYRDDNDDIEVRRY